MTCMFIQSDLGWALVNTERRVCWDLYHCKHRTQDYARPHRKARTGPSDIGPCPHTLYYRPGYRGWGTHCFCLGVHKGKTLNIIDVDHCYIDTGESGAHLCTLMCPCRWRWWSPDRSYLHFQTYSSCSRGCSCHWGSQTTISGTNTDRTIPLREPRLLIKLTKNDILTFGF